MDNIFDIEELDDIPDQIKLVLNCIKKKKKKKTMVDKIIELLSFTEQPVSVDQIMVAYYRFFKESPKKGFLYAELSYLLKNDKVSKKSVTSKSGRKIGVYSLANK